MALTFGTRGRTLSLEEKQAAQASMSISVEISAVNNFCNLERHPQHRDAGAEISERYSLTDNVGLGREIKVDVALGIENHRVIRGTLQEFDALASNRAPWFVPVAQYDSQAKDWITPDAAKPESWRATR